MAFKLPKDRMEELRDLQRDVGKMDAAAQRQTLTSMQQSLSTEQDPLLRAEMLAVVGSIEGAESEAILAAGLRDSDMHVRVRCCEMLGQLGGSGATQILTETLSSDTNVDVRLAAARALGKCGEGTATSALAAALDDKDPAMQYRAMESLAQLTGEDLGYDVAAWQAYLNQGTPVMREESIVQRLRRLF